MSDGSTMTLPPPSFVAMALERLGLAGPALGAAEGAATGAAGGLAFLDVGCGSGYVTALAACLVGERGAAGRAGGRAGGPRLHGVREAASGWSGRAAWPRSSHALQRT